MLRATTPKQTFTFSVDPSLFEKILISYAQNDKIVLEKRKEDLSFETIRNASDKVIGYAAYFRMTQEETNSFVSMPGKQVAVQVRVKTSEGEVLASEKKTISVQDVINDEVL